MSFIQLSQVAVVLARTTGKKALYLAAPLYFVVGITVFLLFAGNGMDSSHVTTLAFGSAPLRLGLLVGWAMLTLPVARLLLTDPQTFFLRALPIPRWWLLGIAALASAGVQLAWLVLWVRGAGALSGCIALLAVLGAQGYAVAGLGGVREWVGLGGVFLGWQLAPSPMALALLVPAVVHGQRLAWIRAPEPRGAGRHRVLASSAALAAATALGISAYRSNGSAVARATTLAVLAFVGISLGLRNNPEWTPEQVLKLALAIWGMASVLGGVTLARPILTAESELTWLLDVCGTSLTFRALTGIGLLAVIGAVGGCLVGLASWAIAPGAEVSITVVLHLAVAGAALGANALALVRISARGTGRDSGRQLLGVLGLCVGAGATLLSGSLHMIAFSIASAVLATAGATKVGVVGTAVLKRAA